MRRSIFALTLVTTAGFALLQAQAPMRPAQPVRSSTQPAPPRPAPRASAPRVSAPMVPSVDPALFKGMRYRLVGPSRGGRVTTVTGVPSQPRTFYMGVASGGVFRTTDAGATWVPITDGKVPVASMGSIAVAESNPNVIYVGTG